MTLINKLQHEVTPNVLAATVDRAGDEANKSNLLTAFYAIFAARLSEDKHEQAALVANQQDGNSILRALFGSEEAELNSRLAQDHNLSAETAGALTSVSAPLILAKIREWSSVKGTGVYLRDELAGLKSHIPAWALALLPAGLLAAPAATHVEPAPVVGKLEKVEKENKGGFLKGLLPLIGLIILGLLAWLLLRACQDKPAPVAAPVASTQEVPAVAANADVQPATVSLAVDETGKAIYSCSANASSEGVLSSVRTAIAGVFGTENCSLNTHNDYADNLPAAEYLPAIFGLMKDVPSSTVNIVDKTIYFNAANEADIEKLIADTTAIVPSDFTVVAEPALDVAAKVAQSVESAKVAITNMGEQPTVEGLIRALNLQIINFELDSAEIPAENKEILDLAADKFKELPDLALTIVGHTDNQASHEYNQELSEKRAAAVRDYLVSKGVSADRLTILGASYDFPVASNATEQGRFQNRRIEFRLVQDGEKIATVGNEVADKEAVAVEETSTTQPEATEKK
ncbi:OmpA family protein [Moraxella nasovis]|uniref:OmpA family protein n=1 Tax=Moraxella nasovis TaxID=2904121 RepID=UPI001F61952D|nr:OmpA family protein [Moraxella nasovis]UNU72788.1 OmpA family protein [Moraxella nasovis]